MLKYIAASAVVLSLAVAPTVLGSQSATAEIFNAPTSSVNKTKTEWDFSVTNNGVKDIVGLEAIEMSNGSAVGDWRPFANSAIAPGSTSAFKWGSSTENTSCTWAIRAVYADGYSAPASFDFCKEANLVFNN
jgi:hypothetical protein